MKHFITLSVTLVVLATACQGFVLNSSSIRDKLPRVSIKIKKPSSSQTQSFEFPSSSAGSSSSTSALSGSFESLSSLSEPIPPVTLYEYPPQQQVIYRTVRPVVRRTVYVQTPITSNNNRGIQDVIGNLIPNPISQGLAGIKSIIGNALNAPTTAPLIAPVPAPTVAYYIES